MPIRRVDDCDLDAPGPVTSRLLEAYSDFLGDEATSNPVTVS